MTSEEFYSDNVIVLEDGTTIVNGQPVPPAQKKEKKKDSSYMGKKGMGVELFNRYVRNEDGHLSKRPNSSQLMQLLDATLDTAFEHEQCIIIAIREQATGHVHTLEVPYEKFSTRNAAMCFSEEGYDTYFTGVSSYIRSKPSYSRRASRKSSRCWAVHSIVLDFDCHDDSVKITPQLARSRAIVAARRLAEHQIKPSAIVYSGRGFHIYITIPSIGAKNSNVIRVYKSVCRAIVDDFRDVDLSPFSIDPVCTGDITHLFRVPGTYNEKAGQWCQLLYCEQYNNRVQNFSDIVRAYLSLNTKAPFCSSHGQTKGGNLPVFGRHSFSLSFVPEDIRRVICLRHGDLAGFRHTALFIAMSSYLVSHGYYGADEELRKAVFTKGRQIVLALNDMLNSRLPRYELDNIFRSCQSRRYAFSKTKIVSLLNLTDDERVWLSALASRAALRARKSLYNAKRYRGGNITGLTVKQKERLKRAKFILECAKAGMDSAAITESIAQRNDIQNCSLRTVQNVLRNGLPYQELKQTDAQYQAAAYISGIMPSDIQTPGAFGSISENCAQKSKSKKSKKSTASCTSDARKQIRKEKKEMDYDENWRSKLTPEQLAEDDAFLKREAEAYKAHPEAFPTKEQTPSTLYFGELEKMQQPVFQDVYVTPPTGESSMNDFDNTYRRTEDPRLIDDIIAEEYKGIREDILEGVSGGRTIPAVFDSVPGSDYIDPDDGEDVDEELIHRLFFSGSDTQKQNPPVQTYNGSYYSGMPSGSLYNAPYASADYQSSGYDQETEYQAPVSYSLSPERFQDSAESYQQQKTVFQPEVAEYDSACDEVTSEFSPEEIDSIFDMYMEQYHAARGERYISGHSRY